MALSLRLVRKFSVKEEESNQDVLNFITDKVLSEPPTYTRLVIVMEGRFNYDYMHAITIRRKDFSRSNKKNVPNFWLLDFLNDNPVQFKEDPLIPGIKFDLDKDIGAHYHKWYIYNHDNLNERPLLAAGPHFPLLHHRERARAA